MLNVESKYMSVKLLLVLYSLATAYRTMSFHY